MYKCSQCGLGVIVVDLKGNPLEKPIKACDHKAPVTMDLGTITINGKGGLKQK